MGFPNFPSIFILTSSWIQDMILDWHSYYKSWLRKVGSQAPSIHRQLHYIHLGGAKYYQGHIKGILNLSLGGLLHQKESYWIINGMHTFSSKCITLSDCSVDDFPEGYMVKGNSGELFKVKSIQTKCSLPQPHPSSLEVSHYSNRRLNNHYY